MLGFNLKLLADTAVKTANLGTQFDPGNTAHVAHLQKVARAAQDTCAQNWQGLDPVQKIARRQAIGQAYRTLSALEKWASVLEKTAAVAQPSDDTLLRAAMQVDEPTRAAFRTAVPGILATGTLGGVLGGMAAGKYLGVPGAVGGTLLGGTAGFMAGNALVRAQALRELKRRREAAQLGVGYSILQPAVALGAGR